MTVVFFVFRNINHHEGSLPVAVMSQLLSSRSFRISLSVLIVFSLVCTQIPLLNYLGFEFSVFMGIVGSFVAGLLTLSALPETVRSKRPRYCAKGG